MSYDIGTARGVIEMQYNGRGVADAEKDLAGLEKKGGSASGALKKVGSTALAAGAVVATGLGLAINSAANFEQRVSGIAAVSGASGKALDDLRGKALQLGKDTQFSATDAATAIEELAKAGLSVPDILNGAADATVNLAAAGEIALPQAATIAANAMNQFNLAARDMPKVADAIAGAANASAIDVSQFGQSLQQVGAVANLAGVDFKDTATAIAIMGNAGITGSDAGTSLKSMFQRLQPVTKKQAETFKQLGLITADGSNKFYDAKGNLKSLADVSGILQKSLKGMTAQQKQATLSTLFGTDAIRAAAILSNAGAKGFDKMAKSMGKVSAADVAKKRMDNFKGSLEQMKGSLETAGIAIGTILIPPLRTLVDALTQALNWFLNLSDGQQKFIAIAVTAVGAILLIAGAVIKVTFFLRDLHAALVLIRGAMAATWLATLGPIALVIAAIALVVAAIIILWKHSETFRAIVTGAWNAVKAAALAVAQWFMGPFIGFFTGVWASFMQGLSQITGFFKSVWNGLKGIVLAVFTAIATVIRTYINIYKTVIMAGIHVILAVWHAVWGMFGPIVRAVFALIIAIIKLAWVVIKGTILLALQGIKVVFSATWHAMAAVVRAVWGTIRAVVSAGANAVRGVVVAVWNAIRGATSAAWNAIRSAVAGPINAVRGIVSSAVNAAKGALTAAWNAAHGATVAAWNAIKTAVSSAVAGVIGIVSTIGGRVLGAIGNMAGLLYSKGQEIVQGLIDGIASKIGAITSAIHNITSAISSHLPGSPVKEGPLRVINKGYAGKQIVQMVIDGIESMTGPLSSAMSDAVLPTASGALTTPLAGMTPRPTRAHTGSGSRGLRFIKGHLTLDASGRAFISGVAADTDDENADYNDTLDRMN